MRCTSTGACGAATARWSREAVASSAVAVLGLMTVSMATLHALPTLMAAMAIAGGAWLTFISQSNALMQVLAPDWVRARVLAVFLLVTQGALAAGSVLWGTIGTHAGIDTALLAAGLATLATTPLGLVFPLPTHVGDLSPWNHWRMPAIAGSGGPASDDGPVLVTVEYRVAQAQVAAFLNAMHEYGGVRRRDGASRWGVFRDVEDPDRFIESFIVASWAEHLRQHERLTFADRDLEDAVHRNVQRDPVVHHLIYAEPGA